MLLAAILLIALRDRPQCRTRRCALLRDRAMRRGRASGLARSTGQVTIATVAGASWACASPRSPASALSAEPARFDASSQLARCRRRRITAAMRRAAADRKRRDRHAKRDGDLATARRSRMLSLSIMAVAIAECGAGAALQGAPDATADRRSSSASVELAGARLPRSADDRARPSELTDRARDVFRIVVESYLDSGAPVGSRTIAQISGLNLSPASIRNVMQDLEEAGLLAAPHTSRPGGCRPRPGCACSSTA